MGNVLGIGVQSKSSHPLFLHSGHGSFDVRRVVIDNRDPFELIRLLPDALEHVLVVETEETHLDQNHSADVFGSSKFEDRIGGK